MTEFFPDKNTKIFISISSNPGNSGSLFHNTAFRLLKLNCIYVPLKLNSLDNFFSAIKKIGIRGCSVSMPFKQEVVKFLNSYDSNVKSTSNCNTILIKKNKLYGKNTDIYGAERLLEKSNLIKKTNKTSLILGGGAVSKSISQALINLGFQKIFISSRNPKRFDYWKKNKKISIIKWSERNSIESDLLINATPLGMPQNKNYRNRTIIDDKYVENHQNVFDVVVSNKLTPLVMQFKNKYKNYYTGAEMSFYQAVKQFEVYNNCLPPVQKLKRIFKI